MLDPRAYQSLPSLEAPEVVTLVEALASAKPPFTNEAAVQKALDRLVASGVLLAGELQKPASVVEPSKRPVDDRADNVLYCLRDTLEGIARLAGIAPRGDAARAALTRLFPDGSTWIRANYEKQWAEMKLLVARVQDPAQGGRAAIDALVGGPEIMDELLAAYTAYGLVMEVTAAAAPKALPRRVQDLVRALRRDILTYALKVVATVDDDEPETEKLAEKALEPIDRFRADAEARAGRAKSGSGHAGGAGATVGSPTEIGGGTD